MDILTSVTDIYASKEEVIRDLLALLIDTLTDIRTCLFEECKEKLTQITPSCDEKG